MPGVALEAVDITKGGALYNDRRWALVDEAGGLISGKNNKRIFSLRPVFDLDALTVCFSDKEYADEAFSLQDAEGLSSYFSAKLGQPVFIKEDKRQGFPDDMNASGPTVVSRASLEEIATWYPTLSLDDIRARFRINLEISSVSAFWEDGLFKRNELPKTMHIGSVEIQTTNPCARCSVPTKSPSSGKRYDGFYKTFIDMRLKTKPNWTDASCFDHWYRLSVNTNINLDQSDKTLTIGDVVRVDGE